MNLFLFFFIYWKEKRMMKAKETGVKIKLILGGKVTAQIHGKRGEEVRN